MSEAPVQAGDVISGKYLVERLLGVGGMGVVVAAWHQELEQRVAVKFLHQEVAARPDAAERFRREARAAARIRSEHVGRVLDVGTHEGRLPYLVMEFLEGHDLATELAAVGPLPIGAAVDYVLQACEAVAEAHAAGIVHRDLKPSNLFLSRRADGSVCVKVLDFGISKTLGGNTDLSLTKTSSLVGSPLYMSPEHMRSARDVDERADVWALGVILYELLTGRTPYKGQTVTELVAMLMTEPPPSLRGARPDAPPDLEAVILRALERDRDRRWGSVGELAAALVPHAPPGSAVHAERVARILSSGDRSRASGEGNTPRSHSGMSPHGAATPPPSASSQRASGRSTPDAGSLENAPTVAEFGTTGPGPAPRGARKLILLWGSASALAVVVAGGMLLGDRAETASVAAPPAPDHAPATPAGPELGATPAGPELAATPAGSEPAATPASTGGSPSTTGSQARALPASPAPPARASGEVRRVPHGGAARPPRPVARDQPSGSLPTGSGITDFGGRR